MTSEGNFTAPVDPKDEISKAHHAFDRHDTFYNQLNEITVASGTAAVRSAFLLNGGAALALLAFAANTLTSEVLQPGRETMILEILGSLPYFAWGAFASAVTMGLAFLANRTQIWSMWAMELHYQYPHVRDGKKTKVLNRIAMSIQVAAILATAGSLGVFLVGLLRIARAIPADL